VDFADVDLLAVDAEACCSVGNSPPTAAGSMEKAGWPSSECPVFPVTAWRI
jgi:hypothetical protein